MSGLRATERLRYGARMRVLFIGGTGPVGQAAIPHLLAAGHDVVLAHTGAHEPSALAGLEHLHGDRGALLAAGGAAERARPDAIVDTFAGGASAEKARLLAGPRGADRSRAARRDELDGRLPPLRRRRRR
jgi:nucleoside-diphosphate-sugar epimerase